MDSSNNQQKSELVALPGDYTIADLRRSEFPEEKELAKKAAIVLRVIIEELKPILKYVAPSFSFYWNEEGPGGSKSAQVRAIEIGVIPKSERCSIFLGEDGHFFSAEECHSIYSDCGHCKERHFGRIRHGTSIYSGDKGISTSAYEHYPFELLLESLQKTLKVAQEKREIHLASIRKRGEMLEQIMEILKPVS